MSKFPDIKLPVWMSRGEPLTLAHASKIWWERVYGWLTFPLAQIDVDTCDEQLLTLLAYQRDINRFPGESLGLFRLRVKYAFVNAQDAGSKAGFARIFERLEIGKIQQLERQLWLDWDVILLRINDKQLSRGNALMMNLVRQYGRTCRRYFFDVLNQRTASVRSGRFDLDAGYHDALFVPTFEIVRYHVNGWMSSTFQPVTSFLGAYYVIEAQGSAGAINWSVRGPASVTSIGGMECMVVITGPGNITVTGTDTRDRTVTHEITPSLWFIQDGTTGKITEFEAWASSVWGRVPSIRELTFNTPVGGSTELPQRGRAGSLWSEWGDMAVYGWPGAPAVGMTWADWWITLSAAPSPPINYVHMPILSGTHNRAQEHSSNGTVETVSLSNTNAFRRCAIWDAATPFQITGFIVNGWNTPTFTPTTSFAGAAFKIRLLGQFGPVSWAITGPATINTEGVVTITGPGAVSVIGTNAKGETVAHCITPTRYFVRSASPLLTNQVTAFVASSGGTQAKDGDLTLGQDVRAVGALWSEWGNMGVYGWPVYRANGVEPERWRVSIASRYSCVYLSDGSAFNYGESINEKRYAVAVVDY